MPCSLATQTQCPSCTQTRVRQESCPVLEVRKHPTTHRHAHKYAHTCTDTHTHTRIHAHTYIHTYIHTHACTHARTHAHTHTQALFPSSTSLYNNYICYLT